MPNVKFAAKVIKENVSDSGRDAISRFLSDSKTGYLSAWGVEIHQYTWGTEISLPKPFGFASDWLYPEEAKELAAMLATPSYRGSTAKATEWNAPNPSLHKTGPNCFWPRSWEGGVWL